MVALSLRLEEIRTRIEIAARKSGRSCQDVTLVAVSKMVDDAAVRQAYDLGMRDFGENRVQELIRKREHLPQARWHLIGRLQTNKVKDVLGKTCLIHSLDRWKLAEEINKQGQKVGIQVQALVQVNVSREASKAGLMVNEVGDFLRDIGDLPALRVMGLMTMAEQHDHPEASRPVFRELAKLRIQLQRRNFSNVNLQYLSMGMSQDFETAIEEGANIVRIGSALFEK